MSILIKGMEMPKDGYRQVFIDSNGTVTWFNNGADGQTTMYKTKAFPAPPHGDLIEKNVIEKAINDACAECKDACIEFDGFFADCDQCILQGVKKALTDAPTVIPADELKEE